MDFGVVIHDFQTKLAESNTLSDEASWIDFYRRVWPNMIACVRIDKDSKFQRWGVDREVKLSTGVQYTIDEKKRTKDYGDFLAEEFSVWYSEKNPSNKIGWTLDKDKRCDYVAYAVIPSARCYLLPFDLLRRTAQTNWATWRKNRRYPVDAQNGSYLTRNCPVPWDVLWRDMEQESKKSFGTNGLVLPQPFVAKDQLLFEFSERK